jgi:hypothetical protein
MRGKKLRSDNDRHINSAVIGKISDPPVMMTGIMSRFISRPAWRFVDVSGIELMTAPKCQKQLLLSTFLRRVVAIT